MMMLLPLLIVSSLFAYLEFSVGFAFQAEPILFWAFNFSLLIPFLAQLWMVLVYFRSKEDEILFGEDFFKRIAYFGMGYTSFLLALSAVRDLVGFILHFFLNLAAGKIPTLSSVPDLHSIEANECLLAATLLLFLIAYLNARFVIKTPEIELKIQNLPSEFQNFKIVQLSDVHLGTGPKLPQVQKIMTRALSLNPDLIALTGDIIDGAVSSIQPELSELGRLKAPFGVFFVMGNHEYYWNGPQALSAIQKIGITSLQNQSVMIHQGSSKLQISGMDDLASSQFGGSGPIAPKRDPDADVSIMLAHQPQTGAKAEAAGYDLQLSGHTHGGQFFPWNWAVKFMYPVSGGLGLIKKMQLYVSHGTGYWGPPLRLGTQCEITSLVLVKKEA